MDDNRNAHLLGGAANGDGNIAAESNNDIRLDLDEPLLSCKGALLDKSNALEKAQRMVAIEAGSLETLERNARLGNKTRLDALRRAREANLAAALGQNVRQCQCRVDVTCSATTGKNYEHIYLLVFLVRRDERDELPVLPKPPDIEDSSKKLVRREDPPALWPLPPAPST